MDSKEHSYKEGDNGTGFASMPLMPIFYVHPRGEGDSWHVTQAVVDTERSGDLSTNASSEDLYSVDSQFTNRSGISSFSSTASLDSVAQWSAASTPQGSPVSTPITKRKARTSLKLDVSDSTWKRSRERKKRGKIKHHLQSQSAKVFAAVKGQKLNFRLKLLLIILFSCAVGIVSYARYVYNKSRRQLVIGGRIEFHELKRELNLLDNKGNVLSSVSLGMDIPDDVSPYNCGLESSRFSLDLNLCVEWKYRARLSIKGAHSVNISCYSIMWESLNSGTRLRDCINMRDAYWYGVGDTKRLSWPLAVSSDQYKPFVTGELSRGGFGPVLERYWLSSKGVAIRVDPEVPLYISFNSSGNEMLCFESKYEGFPYYSQNGALPELRYAICTASSIHFVHEGVLKKSHQFPDGYNVLPAIEKPLWALSSTLGMPVNQSSLQVYANDIFTSGFDPGFILINQNWQARGGDFEFNVSDFPNIVEIFTILHRKNFRILLTVHPYVCLESYSFVRWADQKRFVSDQMDQAPLLTRWQGKVCAIVDMVKNSSATWFMNRLEELKNRTQIDGFVFVGGLTSYLPRNYHFGDEAVNPDCFVHRYLQTASFSTSLLGANVGFETQDIASFLALPPRTSTWDSTSGLRSIIPAVLTLNLLGYPVVNPGSIGGEMQAFTSTSNSTPERELYLRWMQLATFMPVLQYSVFPGEYGIGTIELAKHLLRIRENVVIPALKRALKDYTETGAPIIRPLWWLAPNDHNAQIIDSEFVIGEEIIVAPVLEFGKRSRDIYLPPGMWEEVLFKDSIMRGGKWIHNYPVGLYQIAYFTKKVSSNN